MQDRYELIPRTFPGVEIKLNPKDTDRHLIDTACQFVVIHVSGYGKVHFNGKVFDLRNKNAVGGGTGSVNIENIRSDRMLVVYVIVLPAKTR